MPPGDLLDPVLLETGIPRLVGATLVLFLAATLFTSAVAGSAGAGLLLAVVLTGICLLLSELPALAAPAAARYLAAPEVLEAVRSALLVVGLPLACVLGAWAATRRAVLDRQQVWRGARSAAVAAGLAFLAATATVYAVTHRSEAELVGSVPLAGDSELIFHRDADLRREVFTVSLRQGGAERELEGTTGGWPPFVAPESNRVMLPLASGEWVLFGESGREARRFTAHRSPVRHAAGWSPDGAWFALPCSGVSLEWKTDLPTTAAWLPVRGELPASVCPEDSRLEALVLIGEEGDRIVPLPLEAGRHDWWAAWVDEDHLTVSAATEGGPDVWMVIDISRRVPRVDGPYEMLGGSFLVLPGPVETGLFTEVVVKNLAALNRGLPRRDGHLLAWSTGPSSTDLVALRPPALPGEPWRLETLASLPSSAVAGGLMPRAGGLAVAADGTIVWLGRPSGGVRSVYALAPEGGEARAICELSHRVSPGAFLGFRSADGVRRAEWLPAFYPDPTRPLSNLTCNLLPGG